MELQIETLPSVTRVLTNPDNIRLNTNGEHQGTNVVYLNTSNLPLVLHTGLNHGGIPIGVSSNKDIGILEGIIGTSARIDTFYTCTIFTGTLEVYEKQRRAVEDDDIASYIDEIISRIKEERLDPSVPAYSVSCTGYFVTKVSLDANDINQVIRVAANTYISRRHVPPDPNDYSSEALDQYSEEHNNMIQENIRLVTELDSMETRYLQEKKKLDEKEDEANKHKDKIKVIKKKLNKQKNKTKKSFTENRIFQNKLANSDNELTEMKTKSSMDVYLENLRNRDRRAQEDIEKEKHRSRVATIDGLKTVGALAATGMAVMSLVNKK